MQVAYQCEYFDPEINYLRWMQRAGGVHDLMRQSLLLSPWFQDED